MNISKMYESFLKDKEYAVGVSPKTMIYLRNMGAKYFLPIIAPAKDETELRKLVLEATGRIQGLRRARPRPGQLAAVNKGCPQRQ